MDNMHGDNKQCLEDAKKYYEASTPSLLTSKYLMDFKSESGLNAIVDDGKDDISDISSLSETSFEFSKSFEEFSRNSKTSYRWDYIAKKVINFQNNIFVLRRQISSLEKERITKEKLDELKQLYEKTQKENSKQIFDGLTKCTDEEKKAIIATLVAEINEAKKKYFTAFNEFNSVNKTIEDKKKKIAFFTERRDKLKEEFKRIDHRELLEYAERMETSSESLESTQEKFKSYLSSPGKGFKITRFDYEMFLIDNPELLCITDPVRKLVEYEFQHYDGKGENERDDSYRDIWSFLCGKNHDIDKDIHHLDHDSSNTFFRNLVLIPSELHQQLHSVTKEIAVSQHNINKILSEIPDFKDENFDIYKLSSEDAIKKIDECVERIGDKIKTLEDNKKCEPLNDLMKFLTEMGEKYKKAAVLGAEISFHVEKKSSMAKKILLDRRKRELFPETAKLSKECPF